MKVLVIEDSRFLQMAIERVLVKAGHSVTVIADGREGLEAARAASPELILLDMMLPGMEGTSLLKALKKDATTAHIPVVVLSGLSKKNEATLKKAGASGYIEKSSLDFDRNPDALVHSVETMLSELSHN